MANLSISGLQNQILEQIFTPAPIQMANGSTMTLQPIQDSKKELVEYAFKDFVNYFMRLQQEAETAARIAAQSIPQQGPLYASHLHLNVSLEKFAAEDISSFNAQGVQVTQLKTEGGFASRIEILSQQKSGDGTISYAVTVLKLAIEIENVTPKLTPTQSSQVSTPLPVAGASDSAGSSDLQDFLNRSAYANQDPIELMDYENEDAMQLIREEKRQTDWNSQQQIQALLEAAVNILNYLQTFKLKAAFGMTKEESEYLEKSLQDDPAYVAKDSIIRFLKKKQIELEMLRKEVQERLAIQQNDAEQATAFGQFDRMINFYNQAQKTLEVQEFDKDALKNLMKAFNQVNLASADLGTFGVPA